MVETVLYINMHHGQSEVNLTLEKSATYAGSVSSAIGLRGASRPAASLTTTSQWIGCFRNHLGKRVRI